MSETFKGLRTRAAVFVHDAVMVLVAWMLAYWLCFNLGEIPPSMLEQAVRALSIVVPLQIGLFWFFGLYRGVWRFASLPDLMRIVKAVGWGTLIAVGALFVVTRLDDVPRSVPVLYGVVLVVLLGGPRFLYRWLKDRRVRTRSARRVLIAGAGRAGEMLVRDLLRDRRRSYQPIGFVDDDRSKRGKDIHGIRVVGVCQGIPRFVDELEIDLIMLAVPSATAAQMRRLVELCERADIPFRTVPQLDDLMSGFGRINDLRKVAIEDLLGREPVSLDWDGIHLGLARRVVMVTGAGGSIGSELCRQLARLQPKRLVLFENSEFNLYAIEMDLRQLFPELVVEARLGDVRDAVAVSQILSSAGPEVIFHAAAYKHVPMLESQVREAVRNNVLGTRVLAQAAHRHGCAEFVLISTDKAVNPANVMGASKRVAEIFCQNLSARSDTRFITVRFGNVLGSAGSVVPLFREQIARGGPVTVTHPEIERYFMTIPEACQLIMQAAVLGEGSEIFVLDMGKPVKIRQLAEEMIRLSGNRPGEDIRVEYTGLREGEKLYEELFHERERLQATRHAKILLARHRVVDWKALNTTLDHMDAACGQYDSGALMSLMASLVPENQIAPREVAPAAVSNVIALPRKEGPVSSQQG
jgi:FlaA1/EpsC-like NDP-sugar epimerase